MSETFKKIRQGWLIIALTFLSLLAVGSYWAAAHQSLTQIQTLEHRVSDLERQAKGGK